MGPACPLKRDAGLGRKAGQVGLERRHIAEGDFVPMPKDAFDDELEIRYEAGFSHVLVVELLLCREHDGMIVGLEMARRDAGESNFFPGKNDGGAPSESRSAMKVCGLVLGEFRPWSNEAHVAAKDVDELGQFV